VRTEKREWGILHRGQTFGRIGFKLGSKNALHGQQVPKQNAHTRKAQSKGKMEVSARFSGIYKEVI